MAVNTGRIIRAAAGFAAAARASAKTAPAVLTVLLAVMILGTACAHFAPRSRTPGPVMTEDGVRFRYYAPGASRVQLAGDWPGNNWARGDGSAGESDIGLMKAVVDGMWEIVVPLGPGRYKYAFWLDESTWRLDPGNLEEVSGGPGRRACSLVIFLRDGKKEIR